jgi:polyisoprenoid-binding protein YceI
MKYLNTKHSLTCLSIFFLCFCFSQLSSAQTAFKVGPNSSMTLAGTSTTHDWTMTAHSFTGNATMAVSSGGQLSGVSALSLILPVQNLKGDHDGMNTNAYKALKSDQFKDITFKLTSAKVTSAGAKKYKIAALGNLTIAGVTKAVTLNTSATVNANGSISCSGGLPILLSNFGVKPPSLMLGTMKVGNAVTLKYNLGLVK